MTVLRKRLAAIGRVAMIGAPLLAATWGLSQIPGPGQIQQPRTQPGELGPKHTDPEPPSPGANATSDAPYRLKVTSRTVLVPTTVVDKDTGGYVNGLSTEDFMLFDNEQKQVISSGFSYQPLSVVLAVQANSDVEAMLPKLKTVGLLFHGLVTGETGDVAVIAFDHRIRTIQDWTSDPDKLDDAMQKLTAGSSTARSIDAVLEADRMLKAHDRENRRRKIIVLFSSGYDKGSEAKGDETLQQLQFDSVIVYAVDISKFLSGLLKKPGWPAPAYGGIPPEAIHDARGGTTTQTTIMQNQQLGNFANVAPPLWRSVKDLFKLPPDQAFTRMTGGRVYSFARQSQLEQVLSDMGKELQSQYLLSYTPNNQNEPGFHKIRVIVNHPRLDIRARSGYYWGGGQQ